MLVITWEIWGRINNPTSSQTSAPSKEPVVTSKRLPNFLVQISPCGLNRSDFRAWIMMLIVKSLISMCSRAKSMLAVSSSSVIEG